jgi:hypothetical protein
MQTENELLAKRLYVKEIAKQCTQYKYLEMKTIEKEHMTPK